MNAIGKSIFNLQRFQILQTKLNPATSGQIPNDYAYAWYEKLYPIMEENDLHEDLAPYFSITKEQADEIAGFADSEWLQKRYYSFYQYEEYYKVRTFPVMGISRHTLIAVFRYMYLGGAFDAQFWNTLLTPMQYPTEAGGITRSFDSSYLYLI